MIRGLLAAALCFTTPLSGQSVASVRAQIDRSGLNSGDHDSFVTRFGPSAAFALRSGNSLLNISAGIIPEDGVDVGWYSLSLQGGGVLAKWDDVELGFLIGPGAYRINADERREIAKRCNSGAGCLFELPQYDTEWSGAMKSSLRVDVMITRQLLIGLSGGYTFLIMGANHGTRFRELSAGVGYALW